MPETNITPKESRLERDLTQGSIVKNLLQLSWPMIVMEATYMVSQIWDMLWVGKAGTASIAAVGIGFLIVMVISTVDMALIAGARAMIARFIGGRDTESARKVAGQSFIMAICWGLLVTTIGSIFARDMLNLFGMDAEVVEEGVRYLRILFAGWVSLEILIISLYTIQASGDSFNPMLIEICMRAVHLILCPLLVMGYAGFPSLGIAGAALSNVIAQTLGALAGLCLLFSGRTRLKLKLQDFRIAINMAWRILKIGIPSMISMLQSSFSMLVITKIIVPFGTGAIAANSLVSNIQNFIITPNLGLGNGVAVLVGQNLGANQPLRAVNSTWTGAAILQGFLIMCCVAILIWAGDIVKLFNADPELVTIGVMFLKISIVGYLVMGLSSAMMSCITGAGDTLPNMIINIGMIWAVQIPLTYLLANNTSLGVYGIRWALVISTVAGALAYFLYFQSGRWKHKKV